MDLLVIISNANLFIHFKWHLVKTITSAPKRILVSRRRQNVEVPKMPLRAIGPIGRRLKCAKVGKPVKSDE